MRMGMKGKLSSNGKKKKKKKKKSKKGAGLLIRDRVL